MISSFLCASPITLESNAIIIEKWTGEVLMNIINTGPNLARN